MNSKEFKRKLFLTKIKDTLGIVWEIIQLIFLFTLVIFGVAIIFIIVSLAIVAGAYLGLNLLGFV